MNTLSVLKIESQDGIALISKNATQEISPILKNEISRNLNNDVVNSSETQQKFKCLIESRDPPNFTLLKINKKFTIHSVVEFVQYSTNSPSIPFVQDSLQSFDDFIKFRPLFHMILLEFKCKQTNNNESIWTLNFEEI